MLESGGPTMLHIQLHCIQLYRMVQLYRMIKLYRMVQLYRYPAVLQHHAA